MREKKRALHQTANHLRGPMSTNPSYHTAGVHALQAKLACLESLHDVYETQWKELDSLLKRVGFEKGLLSLRRAAEEALFALDNE